MAICYGLLCLRIFDDKVLPVSKSVKSARGKYDHLISGRGLSIIFAMKIWIAKNSEVPVREQLITQITLAVAAGDLEIGEKLPSTREIARRCGLHANTVSSAYQKLVDHKVL